MNRRRRRGQAYLIGGHMPSSLRSWSMTSYYLDKRKHVDLLGGTDDDPLVLLVQKSRSFSLSGSQASWSTDENDLTCPTRVKDFWKFVRHITWIKWKETFSLSGWTDRGMPGCMHWSNLTVSIVILCGQINLMRRRRLFSNTRGRTKRKSFSVWFAM